MLRKVKEGFKRSWKGDKRLGKVWVDQIRFREGQEVVRKGQNWF